MNTLGSGSRSLLLPACSWYIPVQDVLTHSHARLTEGAWALALGTGPVCCFWEESHDMRPCQARVRKADGSCVCDHHPAPAPHPAQLCHPPQAASPGPCSSCSPHPAQFKLIPHHAVHTALPQIALSPFS